LSLQFGFSVLAERSMLHSAIAARVPVRPLTPLS
jgi:hypothetical protein